MILRHACASILLALCLHHAQAVAEAATLSPCTLPELAEPAHCGEIELPENPDRPSGRQLKIAVAVVPATSGRALPDPIVVLMGGPGEDAIGLAAHFARQFAVLRENRDLLLIDQRGTGRSNALRCDLYDPRAPAANLRDLFPAHAVKACAHALSQIADLTQYSYANFVRDLEQVRQALGYDKLNLFAGSYGTRAAQIFVRAFPDSVRTVFFWSVVPIDVVTPITMAKVSEAAFESTFDACTADPLCHAAFPNVSQEFDRIVTELESGTVLVSAAALAHKAPLGRGRVVEWLRAQVYRPPTAAALPWLIHRAHAGDWTPIVEGILAQVEGLDTAFGIGLFFSITCADDMAFASEGAILAASESTALGDYRVRQQQAACEHWPTASPLPDYRKPVRSAVPAMFASGDLDGASPLWFVERVAPGFPNRVEVVQHGQGHTEWNECLGRLYQRFVEHGGVQGIDPSSCKPMPRPRFKTR